MIFHDEPGFWFSLKECLMMMGLNLDHKAKVDLQSSGVTPVWVERDRSPGDLQLKARRLTGGLSPAPSALKFFNCGNDVHFTKAAVQFLFFEELGIKVVNSSYK